MDWEREASVFEKTTTFFLPVWLFSIKVSLHNPCLWLQGQEKIQLWSVCVTMVRLLYPKFWALHIWRGKTCRKTQSHWDRNPVFPVSLLFQLPLSTISVRSPPVDIGISRQVLDRTKDKVTIVVPIKTLQGVENRESQFYGFSLLRSHVSLGILGAYQRQILFLPGYDQYLSLDTTF